MIKVRLVVATRLSQDDFFTHTATGRSYVLYKDYLCLELRLFPNNQSGLPEIYNIAIEESVNSPAVLAFIHDDLHILDFHWIDTLITSLNRFHIVGLAGNKRRVPKQPGWCLVNEQFQWDDLENLSGIVGHGTSYPPTTLTIFGQPDQEVKLLDGLWLACHSSTLIDSNLRFDERFDFDFYDLDFCRQAELKELKMGTCAISVIHESGGGYNSERWRQSLWVYLDKWGN